MKYLLLLAVCILACSGLQMNHREQCRIQNQWGGSSAPWNKAGNWIIGYRTNQKVQAVNIISQDGGKSFLGTMAYAGEGPIGFKAIKTTGNSYNVFNQWGGNSAPWNDGGYWVLGDRDGQRITRLAISRVNGLLIGVAQYNGEGPIAFRAYCI